MILEELRELLTIGRTNRNERVLVKPRFRLVVEVEALIMYVVGPMMLQFPQLIVQQVCRGEWENYDLMSPKFVVEKV
jgi:hypothetical protein